MSADGDKSFWSSRKCCTTGLCTWMVLAAGILDGFFLAIWEVWLVGRKPGPCEGLIRGTAVISHHSICTSWTKRIHAGSHFDFFLKHRHTELNLKRLAVVKHHGGSIAVTGSAFIVPQSPTFPVSSLLINTFGEFLQIFLRDGKIKQIQDLEVWRTSLCSPEVPWRSGRRNSGISEGCGRSLWAGGTPWDLQPLPPCGTCFPAEV